MSNQTTRRSFLGALPLLIGAGLLVLKQPANQESELVNLEHLRPSAPRNVRAVTSYNGTVISWNAPTWQGGTLYQVTVDGG